MASTLTGVIDADKEETTLVVLFIPSVDRDGKKIKQKPWVKNALKMVGECFGGGTAFPKAEGVWRDDERGGTLVYDEPVILHCYTSVESVKEHGETLREFLIEMGEQTGQGAVGLVIGMQYFEIGFPD